MTLAQRMLEIECERRMVADARADGIMLREVFARQQADADADQALRIEQARADAKAVWALADYLMPPDVKESAERWKMSETLQDIWRQAFITGWRAAHNGRS